MACSTPPHVVEDLRPFLQLLSDGSVIRFPDPFPPASPPPDQPVVHWKEELYDASHNLKLRMYKPADSSSSGSRKKLPVLVYFHGGGYILGSFEKPNFHACCLRLAGELPAVVLSADYRLAPEHRLPAAFDDAETALSWVRGQAAAEKNADPWLAESADFSRTFLCGDSAGGNIVHHMAVRVGLGSLSLDPVRVAGCAMLCLMFGGVPEYDQLWRLALPLGSTTKLKSQDHPLANPFAPGSPALDGVALPPMLVLAAGRDKQRGATVDYVERLKAMGKPVELVEFEEQGHAFFYYEPYGDAGDGVVRALKRFVLGDGGAVSN